MSVQSLINSQTQIPIRKMYIKRRYISGDYETEWFRIDKIKSINKVHRWGSLSMSIDSDPSEIGNYEVSGLTVSMINTDGEFNVETSLSSLWAGYLNRRYTKLKIDCGYINFDGSEVGMATIFEGIIDRVTVSEDQLATIECLSYIAILQQYDISDVNLVGVTTVSHAINIIMNQDKITEYIPYVPTSNTLNPAFSSLSYTGDYWDVIKKLGQESSSVPYLHGNVFEFRDRVPSSSVTFNFYGQGFKNSNINAVSQYDDEGADRVRVYWKAQDSNVTVQSSDTLLTKKYLGSPQEIELNNYNDGYKVSILTTYLSMWEKPKPSITFSTRFFLNLINVFDKITISIDGIIRPTDNQFILDSSLLDSDNVLVGNYGGVVIYGGDEWMVTKIEKDIDNWVMIIKAERIVS